MRIPKQFTHKGKTWKVEYEANLVADDGAECEGLCDFEKRVIVLRSSLKGKKKKSVFFHELIHVVLFEAHINPGVRFSAGIEEVICDAVSDLMTTAFTNIKWKK